MSSISQPASLLPELVIDSFAGGGGASEGIQTGFTTVYETEKKGVVL